MPKSWLDNPFRKGEGSSDGDTEMVDLSNIV
jgi:hypothetical protein